MLCIGLYIRDLSPDVVVLMIDGETPFVLGDKPALRDGVTISNGAILFCSRRW